MTKVNPVRGEASVKIDGETYVLRATFNNMAAFQAALNVEGIPALLRMLQMLDPRALKAGIECLAVSGDTERLGDVQFFPHMNAIQEAILKAITGGVEEAKPEGNAAGEAEAA